MNKERKPVLLVDDIVLFPSSEIRLECKNKEEKNIINNAESSNSKELLVVNPLVQKEEGELYEMVDLPSIGVLAEVVMKMDVPNGKSRVVLGGVRRVNVSKYTFANGMFFAEVEDIYLNVEDNETYRNILMKSLERYVTKVPYVSNALISQLTSITDIDELTDLIGGFLPFDYLKKKSYILEINPVKRVTMLIEDMKEDLKIIELEQKIESEVEKELNESQREFFLREKIKVIQKELGDINSKDVEIENLKKKCAKLKCNKKVLEKIKKEINRYENLPSSSPEVGMVREYLDWMLNLPWHNFTKDTKTLVEVEHTLNNSHYALKDVKQRILEYLAVKQNTKNLRSPIICLVGPPGVGKTSLAISIAKSLGRHYTKISVGGINDEAEIIGHRRTYIGANPGRIIQGMRRAGTTNPVFIIDEIDKMTKDIKGDPASSLLEVLDPEQNNKFSDHYIEEYFDLSNVFFIATANYIDQIPYELQDRLEVIELSSYTEYEKLDIAKNHLIPRELEEHGLTELQVRFDDDAILMIIRNYTKEAGVRELERTIASLLRKLVKELLDDNSKVFFKITKKEVTKYLGKIKYDYQKNSHKKEVGVVNGMAYTIFGGDILPIEATYYKGKGNLILTGSLGEVMQESARIALSYIKANMKKFKINSKILEENDIHIHVPEGAVSKDGPSAGIALTSTLVSLFTGISVDSTISMTGEITLRGNVLEIGGLKEKVIGAHRAGIKTIFIPKDNEKDLDEIPDDLKKDLKFIFVSNYEEVYKKLFAVKKVKASIL